MTEPTAEFTFGSWSTPQVPLTIEYPVEVMDEIRAAVSDGLQQLSHGGLEVGGVLFGVRRDNSIRILTWRPITCEHAQGPTLRLSARDRIALARLIEVAKADADLKGLQPVGWFLSHARSDIFLTESDLEIYNGYFSEPWQVTLVLRPTRSGPSRAGFFVREADGSLKSDASHHDFTVEPLARAPAPRELPIVAAPAADVRIAPRPEIPRTGAPPLRTAELVRTPEPVRVIEPARTIEPPRFLSARKEPTRYRWLWAIPASLALIIAGMLIKEKFLSSPNPSFAFRAYNAGETVQLEWDQNSPSIRTAHRAVLDIKDAGETKHYPLTGEQLQDGRMTYVSSSGDLEMRMTVYPSGGTAVQEFTRLVAPATGTANTNGSGPDANQFRIERDRLQNEIRALQEDLRQERARADRNQEMVRILQNRIDVDSARGRSPGGRQ